MINAGHLTQQDTASAQDQTHSHSHSLTHSLTHLHRWNRNRNLLNNYVIKKMHSHHSFEVSLFVCVSDLDGISLRSALFVLHLQCK